MEEKILTSNHKLLASNRSTASLSGVLDVISFDLKEILLETEQGMLTIKAFRKFPVIADHSANLQRTACCVKG